MIRLLLMPSCVARHTEDRLQCGAVPLSTLPQQGVLVVVIERVEPALVDVAVAILKCLFGAQVARAVFALNDHFVAGRPIASILRIVGCAALDAACR